MRKRYRVLIFAALVAALVVPVGYALSVESTPAATPHTHYAAVVPTAASVASTAAAAAVVAPIAIRTAGPESASSAYQMPDAAKLFGIGTVLLGLAAAVRKAI
jgi:uncharacterized membrane protein